MRITNIGNGSVVGADDRFADYNLVLAYCAVLQIAGIIGITGTFPIPGRYADPQCFQLMSSEAIACAMKSRISVLHARRG
jgi:hypothetical protein